ncbi:MAG: tetratricopeptide repeat protein [Methylovirgula sp.]
MVFECIKHSPLYQIEYFSIDKIDVDLFNQNSVLRLKNSGDYHPAEDAFDFYVFNWHFVTMASEIDAGAIKRLQPPKFSIVLELVPGDPLLLMPKEVFDGFIALDPSIEDMEPIYAFPRPLEMAGRKGRPFAGGVPVIGSFGFGTPAKGFELLVEAVNREFDRAQVRINVPHGRYVETDVIHRKPYAYRLEEVCRKIAKPGVEVSFTNDFLSPEDLVSWCAGNDLNCFMYTRALPGLSATTDQCIISGQPLLTLTNDTFRHIHRYIEPYPYQGLRQAIADSGQHVLDIQKDWSKQRFLDLFHRMLDRHRVIAPPGIAPMRHARSNGAPIIVLSPDGPTTDNLFDYAQKLVNALGRSRQHEILGLSYEAASVRLATLTAPPAGVILVEYNLARRMLVEAILQRLDCPKIIIPDADELSAIEYPHPWSNTVVFPRLPIIPFHTVSAGLRSPSTVILLGFARQAELLRDVVGRILRELATVEIVIESGQRDSPHGDPAQPSLPVRPEQRITTANFDPGDPSVASRFGESALIIVHNDTARTRELESLACLAMTTERPVVFTRASPFASLRSGGTYMEDHAIPDLIEMGLSAHIKPLYDFGEWSIATGIRRILDGSWRNAVKGSTRDAIPVLSPEQALQIAVVGTGATAGGDGEPVWVQRRRRGRGGLSRLVGFARATPHFRQAKRLQDDRRWKDAAEQYRQGLALDPERFALWVQYGHAAKESNDLQTAEQAYSEALRLRPNDADLHVQLGHLYNVRGDTVRMRACYNRARELGSQDSHADPSSSHPSDRPSAPTRRELAGDAGACFARGDRLRDAGDWQAAAEAYAAGLKSAPEAVQYWIQLGNMRKEAGDLAQSEIAYRRAQRIAPTDQDLNLQLGHLLGKAGRPAEAVQHYMTAVVMGSRDRYAVAAITDPVDQQRLLREVIRRVAGDPTDDGADASSVSFNREILRACAFARLN